jgi:hypothetical protein
MADEQLYEDPKTGRVYRKKGEDFYPVDTAAAETSDAGAALVGAGETLSNWGRGARMRAAQATSDPAAFYDVLQEQRRSEDLTAGLRQESPIASGVGRVAPYLLPPATGAGLGVSLLLGGGLGALEPDVDPGASIALGAAGSGAAWGLGALMRYRKAVQEGRIPATDRPVAGGARELPGGPGGGGVPGASRGPAVDPGRPGSAAARVQRDIELQGARARGEPAFTEPQSLEDLARAGDAQDVEDGIAIARGRDPVQQRAVQISELGYDPALLGGRAATRDPGRVVQWATDTAKRLGFRLTPGQEYQDPLLLMAEASARSTPYAAAPLVALQEANQGVANQIINKALRYPQGGAELSRIESVNAGMDFVNDSFRKALEAIRARGSEVPGVGKVGGVPAGGLEAAFENIVGKYKQYGVDLGGDFLGSHKLLDKEGKFTGQFDPLGLWEVRQVLANKIKTAQQNNWVAVDPLNQMMSKLDDAIQGAARSQGPKLREAREVYRLIQALEKPGVIQGERNVNLGALYRTLRRGYRYEMRGKTDKLSPEMKDVLDMTVMREAVLRDVVNDSGTATRMSLQMILNAPMREVGAKILGRAAVEGYLRLGQSASVRSGLGALTKPGAEQLSGIWGRTW